MPKMDGVTATHQIRHFDQHTPIVAMTSNTSEVECRNYLEVGMNDVLAKPFSHVSLLDMLERYCSHLLPNHSTVSSPDSSSVENACIDSIQTVFEECDELVCRNSGKSNHLEYDEYTKCDHLPSWIIDSLQMNVCTINDIACLYSLCKVWVYLMVLRLVSIPRNRKQTIIWIDSITAVFAFTVLSLSY